MVKAVIFDLDGTLTVSLEALLEENHADVILENPLQLLDYVPQNAYYGVRD
ncbi:MAG: hypothetical protein HDR26_04695 [Lachnospiraceae bacterium]|nr:hypothetical protein [Lachnospiraceae bacterium]